MQKFKEKLSLVARENLEYNRLKEQRTDAGGKKNEQTGIGSHGCRHGQPLRRHEADRPGGPQGQPIVEYSLYDAHAQALRP